MTVPLDKRHPEKPQVVEEEAKKTDQSKTIVHQGELKKKNKFFWNQDRLFILYRSGLIEYYKDKTLLRGSL